MSVALWRIALVLKSRAPTDLSGRGAEITGGRWNSVGRPVVYAAANASLACLETVVQLNASGLPLNRVLVLIEVPDDIWAARQSLVITSLPAGWDTVPAASVSAEIGNAWLGNMSSLLLMVPSAIVPEEFNVLFNPGHADAPRVVAKAVRPWTYPVRLFSAQGDR